MKCTNCGTEIEEGKLFCPVCGHEVQLVPDYETLETSYYRKKEQAEKKQQRRAKKEAERRALLKHAKRKKRKRILIQLFFVAIFAAVWIVWVFRSQQRRNSFPYQMEQAKACMEDGDYGNAREYLDRALDLSPDDVDAHLTELALLYADGNTERLSICMAALTEDYPDEPAYYRWILDYYETQKDTESIQKLMAFASTGILRKFPEYLTDAPEFSLAGGCYTEKRSVRLHSGNAADRVYYTVNGDLPDDTAELYEEPILLPEGTTVLRAIAYNEKGIPSDVVSETYSVALPDVDAPAIYPKSGEYTTATDTRIYLVIPEGCTAHYAFDRKAQTDDPVYSGPVEMLAGEHTFYAIAIDENGKVSPQGSIVYKLTGG